MALSEKIQHIVDALSKEPDVVGVTVHDSEAKDGEDYFEITVDYTDSDGQQLEMIALLEPSGNLIGIGGGPKDAMSSWEGKMRDLGLWHDCG